MTPTVPCPACSDPMPRDLVVCWPCWRALKADDGTMRPVSGWATVQWEVNRDARVRADRAAMKSTTRHEA